MEKEIWKPVKNYEGIYEVSNLGNIKSLSREIWNGNIFFKSKEKLLEKYLQRNGYLLIKLNKNSKGKQFQIHRLVAEAFIINPENKRTVNHKNGIRNDNRLENLERMTDRENSKHGFDCNGRKPTRLGKFGKEHNGCKITGQYSLDGKLIRIWDCLKDIQRELGFANSNISACCLEKSKTAYGYMRKYIQ